MDTQTRFSIRLYCYGTLGMTRDWLLKDNITPSDVIVMMMFASMPESLKASFFDEDTIPPQLRRQTQRQGKQKRRKC